MAHFLKRIALFGLLVGTAGCTYRKARTERTPELLFDNSFYSHVSLSAKATTLGATDPSWSPDGKELAFSLYGSLWKMPFNGGEAEQLTNAQGYDAGTAWSPNGRFLAFVRGRQPIGGVQIGTVGELRIIELSSGKETSLSPSGRFVGSPAWTRDSEALIANGRDGGESALYLIPITGEPRRLTGVAYSRVSTIVQRGSGWYTSWYPVAVHPEGQEIAFGGDRDGTPQMWRMPLRDGLIITSKLTRYAEKDQADIQDLSWETASSIVFSANLNNHRTNYDLWRWREGRPASIEQVTKTLTDEFTPRTSPDGKTVVFVSNFLGNLDLFTTTTAIDRAQHLQISHLRFKNSAAQLKVHLRDNSGKPVAARVSVRAGDGKYYNPSGTLYRYHGGLGDSSGFFHSSGDFELSVPAGKFRVEAFRGIEHEPALAEGVVAAGKTQEVELVLKRYTAWQGRGWWTGEDHIHANYAGPYYLRPEDVLTMLEAEDLNIANMLVANAEGTRPYDREFFEGKAGSLPNTERIIYWNQEYRNRIVYGHMALLRLTQLIEPIYTSFEGTPHPWDYPSNTMVAQEARNQGATVAYVHPILGLTRDPFDFTVSAKELPVTAALGMVDVLDVYPWGPLSLEIWYRLLNCGLHLSPGAGTDTFSNWRSINQVPGNARVYVKTPQPLGYDTWILGLKQGRSFVTNGPLLSLDVNGKGPGDTLRSEADKPLQVVAKAKVESRVPLKRLELVLNGQVVAKQETESAQSLTLEWKQTIDQSGWMALRAAGAPDRRALGQTSEAHTGAVYLEIGGRPMQPSPKDARLFVDWIDRLWDLIEMRNNFQNSNQKEEVRKLIFQAREFYAKAAASTKDAQGF